jgi:hypothetical protein
MYPHNFEIITLTTARPIRNNATNNKTFNSLVSIIISYIFTKTREGTKILLKELISNLNFLANR